MGGLERMEGKKIVQIDGFFRFDYKYGEFPLFRVKVQGFSVGDSWLLLGGHTSLC